MALIVETLAGDRRVQLGNQEFVRQMLLSYVWTKIRIGMRIAVNGSASFGNGIISIGVCQGTANTLRSSNTTDYIGVQISQADGTWAYTAGPPAYFTAPGSSCLALKRTGNTTTTGSNGNVNTMSLAAVASGTIRVPLYLDIIRGATYNFQVWCPTTVTFAQQDLPSGQFLSDMQNENTPIGGTTTQTVGQPAIAYTGSGLHDSVSINWTNSTNSVEISDLLVIRFY